MAVDGVRDSGGQPFIDTEFVSTVPAAATEQFSGLQTIDNGYKMAARPVFANSRVYMPVVREEGAVDNTGAVGIELLVQIFGTSHISETTIDAQPVGVLHRKPCVVT